jgi:predicted ester cyclase
VAWVVHIGNGDIGNGETLAALFQRIVGGLPDLSLVIDDVIYCGARVVVRFTMSGTHSGPLGLYAATGRVLPSVGVLIARPNANSQTAELWVYLAPAYSVLMPPRGQSDQSGPPQG